MTDLGQIRTRKLNELTPVTNLLSNAIVPVLPAGAGQAGSATVAQIRQPSIIQIVSTTNNTQQTINNTSDTLILSLSFTPSNANTQLMIETYINGIAVLTSSVVAIFSLGWNGSSQSTFGRVSGGSVTSTVGSAATKWITPSNHNSLGSSTRTYQVFARLSAAGNAHIHQTSSLSSLIITEVQL